jgi:hypothetical protein
MVTVDVDVLYFAVLNEVEYEFGDRLLGNVDSLDSGRRSWWLVQAFSGLLKTPSLGSLFPPRTDVM